RRHRLSADHSGVVVAIGLLAVGGGWPRMTRRLIAFVPLIALLVALTSPLVLSAYQVTVITYVMIAAVACIGLVLMTGIVGMVSFGHAAFVGLGAYVSGYLSAQLGLSPWLGLVGAV